MRWQAGEMQWSPRRGETAALAAMGLGLAVTHRLVRAFGWSIGVRREDGRTVFGIEIPAPQLDRGYTQSRS